MTVVLTAHTEAHGGTIVAENDDGLEQHST